jgi:hypothetical protein
MRLDVEVTEFPYYGIDPFVDYGFVRIKGRR